MWLKEPPPSMRAFFPDAENNKFVLNDEVGLLVTQLIVEGSPMMKEESQPTPLIGASSSIIGASSFSKGAAGSSSSGMLSLGRSSMQPKPLHVKKVNTVNVKIIQAQLCYDTTNKPEFEVKNQTFIEVTEETANINFILAAVQRKWGEAYTIVTNDGLEVGDCAGTQGM